MAPFHVVNDGGGPEGERGVRSSLRACAVELGYTSLAEDIGVPTTTLWRFLNDGYEPRKPSIRRALGLPVDPIPQVEMRVCSCGCSQAYWPATWNQLRIHDHPRRRVAQKKDSC